MTRFLKITPTLPHEIKILVSEESLYFSDCRSEILGNKYGFEQVWLPHSTFIHSFLLNSVAHILKNHWSHFAQNFKDFLDDGPQCLVEKQSELAPLRVHI